MFKESVRDKRFIHDFDEAEQRLAKIILTTVAPDTITILTKSVQDSDAISRKIEKERATYHRSDVDGLAGLYEKYKDERQRLKQTVDEVSEGILRELQQNNEACELLNGFSLNARAQLSAVRDATHLIIGAAATNQSDNRGGIVEEMAGAVV